MKDLKVNEIFYSVQGEGPLLGVPSVFVRMHGCNLKCSWCDSKYTWYPDIDKYGNAYEEYTQDELIKKIRLLSDAKHMVFTGGEPLLQEDALYDLIGRLPDKHITFETNGTIDPCGDLFDAVALWMVSPKRDQKFEFDYGDYYRDETSFKFVIEDLTDIAWMQEFIKDYELHKKQVWLMPQAIGLDEMKTKLEWITPYALNHRYNVTPRLQILIWGNKRGV